ncbi:hypothetical protein NDN11_11815 [Acinetobacter sp. C26M]|uniref:hypothetical protein n=1 Tax=unclassified Acinetobacter TaxID=196816 RepID=UPI002036CE12|nr:MULTISPECIES: hypothetical protein [unclassified Acinetobacter]USA45408.1 hypothetical protein NDN11_11815 [Acinetobacter sp. C26M]USA48910.1 hypothetical protein NDN12_11815 [Acinetobacter sp. C26G]
MFAEKNQILSTLHRIVAFILISDLVYAIYNLYMHMPKYFVGGLLGRVALIAVHFLCAKSVKTGSTSSRIGSIVMTAFMLNMFPVGTVIAAVMLFFSIFKWEKTSTFQLPTVIPKN